MGQSLGPRLDRVLEAQSQLRAVAEQYDMQLDPTYRDVMSYPSPTTGQPVSTSFLVPRSREERSDFIGNAKKLGALWSSPQCVVLIANRKDIPGLMKSLVPAPRSVGCEGKKFALINRPGQGIEPPPVCPP